MCDIRECIRWKSGESIAHAILSLLFIENTHKKQHSATIFGASDALPRRRLSSRLWRVSKGHRTTLSRSQLIGSRSSSWRRLRGKDATLSNVYFYSQFTPLWQYSSLVSHFFSLFFSDIELWHFFFYFVETKIWFLCLDFTKYKKTAPPFIRRRRRAASGRVVTCLSLTCRAAAARFELDIFVLI